MTKSIQLIYWLFFLLTCSAFGPLVLSEGEVTPFVLGMPRTLWMGLSISFIMAFLILIVSILKSAQIERNQQRGGE